MNKWTQTARRGGLATITALSALALASCSAGQVVQTDQVAAVDGQRSVTENSFHSLRDVTIVVDDEGTAAMKFSISNDDPKSEEHTLESISVDGNDVEFDGDTTWPAKCNLIGDSAEQLKEAYPDKSDVKDTEACIKYVATSLDNVGYAPGDIIDVDFTFDTGSVTVSAPVSAPVLPSGQSERKNQSENVVK